MCLGICMCRYIHIYNYCVLSKYKYIYMDVCILGKCDIQEKRHVKFQVDTYSKKFHLTHLLQNRIATCKVIQQYLTTDQTVLFALVSNRKKSYYLQKQLYFYCLKFSKDRTVFNTGIRILDIIFCEIPCQTQIF